MRADDFTARPIVLRYAKRSELGMSETADVFWKNRESIVTPITLMFYNSSVPTTNPVSRRMVDGRYRPRKS